MGEEFSAGDHRIVGVYGTPPQESQPKHPGLRRLLAFQGIGWVAVGIGWLFVANETWHVVFGIIFLALGIGNAIRWMRVRRSPSDGPR